MVAIINLLTLASAASASVILARASCAPQVQTNLTNIDTDTKALNTAITNWDGTTTNFGKITDAATKVDNDLKSSTSFVQSCSTNATDSEATSIINYINNTLEPDTNTTLKNLISRKSDISKIGAGSLTRSRLNTLKTDGDNFATALLAKTPSAEQTAGKAALNKIDADFAAAISAFANA